MKRFALAPSPRTNVQWFGGGIKRSEAGLVGTCRAELTAVSRRFAAGSSAGSNVVIGKLWPLQQVRELYHLRGKETRILVL
jgi:hypothetical protein